MTGGTVTETPAGTHTVEDFPVFFDGGIFGVLHRPQCAAKSGWVICNPFGMERTNAHRLLFEWARVLASTGHWVLRFDYRGTGDSAGAFQEFTVHDYRQDIEKAVEEIEHLSGLPCRGLVGLRLGAGLAAAFAAESGRDFDLAMWEPVVDGGKYRDALLRTAMANELVNSGGAHRTRDDFRRELAHGRSVSVDGFSLTPPMYESLSELDPKTLDRPTRGPILVAQIDSRSGRGTRPAVTRMVKAYSAIGDVDFHQVQAPSVWLRTKSYRWRQDELFNKTLGWIGAGRQNAPRVSVAANIEAGVNEIGRSVERPIVFDVAGEKAWGVLHEPHELREDAPNIVFIAAGAICRSGVFYTRLARELANAGWRVLRFDPRGMGDSEGFFDCDSVDEVYSIIEDGGLVPDTTAALDFLEEECGPGASVLTGLCGGAITSVFAAAADDRVVGIAPLDLPLKRALAVGEIEHPPRTQRPLWVDYLSQRRGMFFMLTVRRLFHQAKAAGRLFRARIARDIKSGEMPGEAGWFRNRFGEDANLSMLVALQRVVKKDIPIHCVFVESEEPRLFESALPGLHQLGRGEKSLIEYTVVPGTEHTFTMPGQTEELSRILMKWLDDMRPQF